MAALVCLGSCSSCSHQEQPAENTASIVAENTISVDKEYMTLNYGGNYRWYESSVVFKDFLDEECDGTIEEISNIFQVVKEEGTSADPIAVISTYNAEGDHQIQTIHSYWLEDWPMNDEAIKVTFAEAFEKIQEVDMIKPHSKHCVLRKEVGPKVANPQYIFGNTHAQIYVDATTGEVSDKSPVWEGSGFTMPLGEWP